MGTYTEFHFDATLRKDVPDAVLDYIRHRLTEAETSLEDVPLDDHPFFLCERWSWVLTWHNCNGHGFNSMCKDTDDGLEIHIDTELKNYGNEVEWFLMWIAPLVNLKHPCTKFVSVEGHDEPDNGDCSALIRDIQSKVSVNQPTVELLT